jgi:plastocyanin
MRSLAYHFVLGATTLGLLTAMAPQAGAPPPNMHPPPHFHPVVFPHFPPFVLFPPHHFHHHHFYPFMSPYSGYNSNMMPYSGYQMPYGGYGSSYQMPYGGYGSSYQTPYGGYGSSQSYDNYPTAPQSPTKGVVEVAVYDDNFKESTITIDPGTIVRWTNHGHHVHTVTSDQDVWESRKLNPGDVFNQTFNQTGTYPYHCTIHPSKMYGVVIVK